MPTTITAEQSRVARAVVTAWIDEIIGEIGLHDKQAILELLMVRHIDEMRAGDAISDLLVGIACEAAVQPYLDQGLSGVEAADAAYRDFKRAAEKEGDRQHKRH